MVTPTKASSRSSFIFKTPLPSNDDDDERRRSRSVSSTASSVNVSVLEENEELKVCLQQFMDNKINKENAWNSNLIDTLANLVSGHRKYVKNFQVVGASLEASSKIYGYRVDMVHTEVIRMSGGLTRMNVGGNNDGEQNAENPAGAQNDDCSITETGNDLQDKQAKAKAKAKKRRQQSSTVTKCKASINGKLDTVPFIDPVFADIKSNLGDMNSSNRAFLNTLESCNSELLFDYDKPYWDGTPNDFVMKEEDSPVANDEKFYFMKYKKLDGPVKIRTIFREYNISDKPCDMNKIMQSTLGDKNINMDDTDSDNGFLADDNHDHQEMNDPQEAVPLMTFAFDANAEIEPVQESRTSCAVEMDLNEFSAAEIEALNTVTGAKRTQIVIDTLQPCDASRRKLEYSYRPLTEITKFWAGPSYWKIRPSAPLRTEAQHQQRRTGDVARSNRNVALKRKTKQLFATEIEEPDLTLFKVFDPNRKPINIMKNWDPKKLKLPNNHHIDDEYFDKLSYARGMKLKTSVVITNIIDDVTKAADNENGLQREIPNGIDNNDDVCGGDTDFHNDHMDDDAMENENLNLSTLLAMKHISPQKIEKIVIPYATKAKIINMKQLKLSCSKVLTERTQEQSMRQLTDIDVKYLKKVTRHLRDSNENYRKGYATFHELYKTLPAHLSDVLKDNLSVPIAFSAILHLANEQNFRFVPTDAKKHDFKIIKVLDK